MWRCVSKSPDERSGLVFGDVLGRLYAIWTAREQRCQQGDAMCRSSHHQAHPAQLSVTHAVLTLVEGLSEMYPALSAEGTR